MNKIHKKTNKNIRAVISILIILIITILMVGTLPLQNSKTGNLSTKIQSFQIIHIKKIGTGPTDTENPSFLMGKGDVNFYPKASSVYGKEIDNINFAANLEHSKVIQKDDENFNKHGDASDTSKVIYDRIYQKYLGIFDKVKDPKRRLIFRTKTIILDSKELKKIYPVPQKGPTSWYCTAINLVSDPMVSLKITLDGQGRPIMVAAAAKSKPNYYKKLYKLSYDNNILAYKIGFHRMLKSIENTPEPPEPMDD